MASNPDIGPEGIVKIAAACQNISTSTVLDLREANHGANGTVSIEKMITKSSKSFGQLFLDENKMPSEWESKIRDACAQKGKSSKGLFL